MKQITWILLILLPTTACTPPEKGSEKTSEPPKQSVTQKETPKQNTIKKTEAAAEKPLIIDVRSQREWDSGYVKGAIHIPHTQIADEIGKHTTDKNRKIVVYCAVGGRAGKAKKSLEAMGFTNVENAGGYEDAKKTYE